MPGRILLTGLLGAVAMFVWNFIAHMALPLGEAGIKQIDNEQALLSAMQTTLPAHGLYIFPHAPPDNDMTVYEQKIASGPSGLMVYFPTRDFNFGQRLAVEFFTELLQAILAVWLLSMTRLTASKEVLCFFATIGAIAAVSTNLSYWNWYGFPSTYIASYMLMVFVSYICLGGVAALIGARQSLRTVAAT